MAADKLHGKQLRHSLTWDAQLEVVGFEQMTSLGSAVALTTIPAGARAMSIQCEVANVRLRPDATNPTSGVGMILVANQWYFLNVPLADVRVIQVSAGAKLNISYYGIG